MIQIQLTTAVALYSAILCGMILAIWVYTEVTVRQSHRFLGNQFLWRCVFCGYTYLDEHAEAVSQCPRCASFNSLEDRDAKVVQPRTRLHTSESDRGQPLAEHRNPSRRRRPHQRRRGPRRRR